LGWGKKIWGHYTKIKGKSNRPRQVRWEFFRGRRDKKNTMTKCHGGKSSQQQKGKDIVTEVGQCVIMRGTKKGIPEKRKGQNNTGKEKKVVIANLRD